MPDWIAHLCFAYLVARGAGLGNGKRHVFVAGALLPDVVNTLVFAYPLFGAPTAFLMGLPFHSVFFAFFLSGLAGAALFRGIGWEKAAVLLFGGSLTHLLLDSMMLYTIAGVRPLLPFIYGRAGLLNIFESQNFLPAIFLGAITLLLVVGERLLKRRAAEGAA